MKKIYFMLIAIITINVTCISCKDEEAFITVSANDFPQILYPVFPDRVNGELAAVAQISRDANFMMSITVSPSEYTEVSWEIDGVEMHKGTNIDIPLEAGTYHLKVTATTTMGKSTYREANIIVSPLENDPWSKTLSIERITSPGSYSRLYGTNLELVKGIVIGEYTVSDITFGESELGSYVEYTVPIGMDDGKYRISFVDAEGNRYGADFITITSSPVITNGFERTKAGSEWVMSGLNLDKIATLYANGEPISKFTQQSTTEIAAICPTLSDGEYTLKGACDDGSEVLFYSNGSMIPEILFAVTSKTILWEGHHYVSWDLADDDPHKTFNLIPIDVFDTMIAGSAMNIHYSVAPEAEYHQLRTTTIAWNDLPGTAVIEFSENGVATVAMTQEVLSKISSEGGFLCVGHGYYIDMITIE